MTLNVLGTELKPCSYDPLTGFMRDGCCQTHADDSGTVKERRSYDPFGQQVAGLHNARVGRHSVSLRKQEHVAGDEIHSEHFAFHSVAPHRDALG